MSPAADLLVDWLRRPRFEVTPLRGRRGRGAPARPCAAVRHGQRVANQGLEPTMVLCERLVAQGYRAVPHLAARLVADRTQLRDVLERIHDVGAREACMSGG